MWQDDSVDSDELWLRQYVLGNEWKKEDDALPSYKEIVGVERCSTCVSQPRRAVQTY